MYPVSLLASAGTSCRPATLPFFRLDCLSYDLSYWFITINWLLCICWWYVLGSSGAVLFTRSLKRSTHPFSCSWADVNIFPSLPLIALLLIFIIRYFVISVPRVTLGCCLLRVPEQLVYVAPLISSYTPSHLFVGSCILLLSFCLTCSCSTRFQYDLLLASLWHLT